MYIFKAGMHELKPLGIDATQVQQVPFNQNVISWVFSFNQVNKKSTQLICRASYTSDRCRVRLGKRWAVDKYLWIFKNKLLWEGFVFFFSNTTQILNILDRV